MKPKIALIVDTDNWAFYNRANLIKERLSEYFDFKIIPIVAIDQNILQVILMIQDCDLVHFFWRGFLFSLDNENYFFKRNQIDVNKFIEEKFSKIVKTTCIPDHALLDLENIDKTKKVLNFPNSSSTEPKFSKKKPLIIPKQSPMISFFGTFCKLRFCQKMMKSTSK